MVYSEENQDLAEAHLGEHTQVILKHHPSFFLGLNVFSDDFLDMLRRSKTAGLKTMIITGGSLRESKQALDLAKQHGAQYH